ncbi:hypothetical protein B0H16DRAFT_1449610 [Mycena metata]|uniref:Uncharacterized protein n=1 Tax=Mycena metata TaxID=1033252 RepID=A0AAD7K382_9AGAR|nr:hypothetical protein B0H16DRAFT_1449610 [Mycena metata]
MSPEIHANDIREIADASSPEIGEKARKELLEMAGNGGSLEDPETKLARAKKTVGATRGGGSEQSKMRAGDQNRKGAHASRHRNPFCDSTVYARRMGSWSRDHAIYRQEVTLRSELRPRDTVSTIPIWVLRRHRPTPYISGSMTRVPPPSRIPPQRSSAKLRVNAVAVVTWRNSVLDRDVLVFLRVVESELEEGIVSSRWLLMRTVFPATLPLHAEPGTPRRPRTSHGQHTRHTAHGIRSPKHREPDGPQYILSVFMAARSAYSALAAQNLFGPRRLLSVHSKLQSPARCPRVAARDGCARAWAATANERAPTPDQRAPPPILGSVGLSVTALPASFWGQDRILALARAPHLILAGRESRALDRRGVVRVVPLTRRGRGGEWEERGRGRSCPPRSFLEAEEEVGREGEESFRSFEAEESAESGRGLRVSRIGRAISSKIVSALMEGGYSRVKGVRVQDILALGAARRQVSECASAAVVDIVGAWPRFLRGGQLRTQGKEDLGPSGSFPLRRMCKCTSMIFCSSGGQVLNPWRIISFVLLVVSRTPAQAGQYLKAFFAIVWTAVSSSLCGSSDVIFRAVFFQVLQLAFRTTQVLLSVVPCSRADQDLTVSWLYAAVGAPGQLLDHFAMFEDSPGSALALELPAPSLLFKTSRSRVAAVRALLVIVKLVNLRAPKAPRASTAECLLPTRKRRGLREVESTDLEVSVIRFIASRVATSFQVLGVGDLRRFLQI